jgi:AraC-like DNA-binding protein
VAGTADEAAQDVPPEADIVAYLAALLRLAREGTPGLARWRLLTLVDAHIRQSLGEPQRPADLAALFGISERTLHRIFADAHTTFERHLLRRRAERLRELLSQRRWSQISIGKLAVECGFADAAHASRAFKAFFHATPADYRADALAHREQQMKGEPCSQGMPSPRSPDRLFQE